MGYVPSGVELIEDTKYPGFGRYLLYGMREEEFTQISFTCQGRIKVAWMLSSTVYCQKIHRFQAAISQRNIIYRVHKIMLAVFFFSQFVKFRRCSPIVSIGRNIHGADLPSVIKLAIYQADESD